MTREDIIRMAHEAKFYVKNDEAYSPSNQEDHELTEYLERFAALVASAERERIKQANAPEIERINAHIKELEDAVIAERKACAEICKKHADFYAGLEPSPIAQSAWAACVDNRDTIRARGQA